ncbi:MAG: response regulator transcription factor [Deltaproteobacteria bacterium]|nr:response regulator transcription factor [Deltaproteobacteria bacterium]
MRILFVENHDVFADGVRARFLAAHEVVIVPSLAGAREALARTSFEVILVDFDLDDGKGVELVQELCASGSKAPTIVVSAREDGNQALLTAGAMAAVSKLQFNRIEGVLAALEIAADERA